MNNSLKIFSPKAQFWFLLALWLGGSLLVVVVMQMLSIPAKNTATETPIGVQRMLLMINSVCSFLLPAHVFSRLAGYGSPTSFLGLRPAQKPWFYWLGVVILLISFPLQGYLGQLNAQIPFPKWVVDMEEDMRAQTAVFLSHRSPMDLLINLLMIAAIPAICEEAFFRGALQRIFIQGFNKPWPAIILTGAVFSFIHMEFLGFFPRMSMGILLGAIYWYSGSLWTSILAHFFVNGIQIYAVWYNPKLADADATVPLWMGLLSLAIVVGLVMLFRSRSTTTFDSFFATEEEDQPQD